MNFWIYRLAAGGLIVSFLMPPAQVLADEAKPVQKLAHDYSLWEVGLVAGGAYLPDYPAAGQNHSKWIAAPYLIYRGNILRADREGARARLIRHKYFDL